jgi:predicted nucleic acid-binding protein
MVGRAGKQITRVPAFWDSSALVPLCVRQGITPKVVSLFQVHDVVVWWTTPVEIASALFRLLRMKQIDGSDCVKARKLARVIGDYWSVIQPSDALRGKAVQLVERYDLRAADSLQLAAALEWCEDVSQGRVFLTADERLRQAAVLSGFDAGQI